MKNKKKGNLYKLFNVFNLLMLVLNMSFVGVFFVATPDVGADTDDNLCTGVVDVVLTMDRSGSMDNGSPSNCEWQNLEWVVDTNKCVPYSENGLSEPECIAKDDGATQCPSPTFTPVVPGKIDDAKEAAISFLGNMGPGDQSALVSYANDASLDKTLSNEHTGSFPSTEYYINNLNAVGGTNIGDAILLAVGELNSGRANSQAVKAIILLTDGKPTCPYEGGVINSSCGIVEEALDVQYAEDAASQAAAQGFKVFTIGIGSDTNVTLLQDIASMTNAEYYPTIDSSNLKSIYDQISTRLCEYGSISGCKFIDENDNQTFDTGENATETWQIELSGDATSTQDTDQSGCYSFTGLSEGNYVVNEVNKTGFTQVYPLSGIWEISLSDTEDFVDANFGNAVESEETGSITINKISDCAEEEFDFTFDGMSFSLKSGSSTTMDLLDAGVYYIEENLSTNWSLTTLECIGASTTKDMVNNGVYVELFGGEDAECTFTNAYNDTCEGTVTVNKYRYDGEETTEGLADWEFTLVQADGDHLAVTGTTSAEGAYTFENIKCGEYRLIETEQNGWTVITPSVGYYASIFVETEDLNPVFNFYNEEVLDEPYCGDGTCDDDEDCGTCSEDCDECVDEPYCGDGTCDCGENVDNCCSDCADTCSSGSNTLFPTNRGGGSASTPSETQTVVLGEEGAPNLFITKEVSPNQVNRGDTDVEYVINVSNNGILSAFTVVLTDTLPSGLNYSNYEEQSHTWDLGDIAPGETKSTSFIVNVADDAPYGNLTNVASAVAENHDEISADATIKVVEVKVLAESGFSWLEFFVSIFSALSLFVIGRRLVLKTV